MEYSEHGFLEELLVFPSEMREIYTNQWNFEVFEETPNQIPIQFPQNSSFEEINFPQEQGLSSTFNEFYSPFGDQLDNFTDNSTITKLDTPPFFTEEYSMPVIEGNGVQNLGVFETPGCKTEPILSGEGPGFDLGFRGEIKGKVKKIDGQPSKNLMAERRRRKRLNDRLSMLRSVVPKISKMDRTSILGDTIDYMKELLERINNLQEEIEVGSDQLNLMTIFKDLKSNEVQVRNSPKFDIERRDTDTRVEISCATKPGLLLSTVNTLEALGLEIQQCVISCFNDFSMQASCSEEMEQRAILNSEEIKQALFRNAGYGGRCL